MTKYNNSIIYKLVCKDSTINDIYIGSTTNFTKRKCNHKASCNNTSNPNHNEYKYEFIRAHGGWNNWDMVEILKVNCNNGYELQTKEREQFDLLKPTLNKYRPQLNNIEWHEQHAEIMKTYYEKNKDKLKANNKIYYEANIDNAKAQRRAYYEANKDKIKAQHKARYEANKAEKLAAIEASN